MGYLGNTHVGDCSIRLSLAFPATWTTRNTSSIVGNIWSSKNDFPKIMLQSFGLINNIQVPGARYEYSEIGKVKKLCPQEQLPPKNLKYANGFSKEMSFHMWIRKFPKGKLELGSVSLLTLGDKWYDPFTRFTSNTYYNSMINMSYRIHLNDPNGVKLEPYSLDLINQVEINAEGTYNGETRRLCMVGCRILKPRKALLMDCEIVIKFKFPRNVRDDFILGSINSTRNDSHPLYFEPLLFFGPVQRHTKSG